MDSSIYEVQVGQVRESLTGLYDQIIAYLPNLLAAAIVLILGWVVGIFLSKLVHKLLDMIKIDHAANQLGLKTLSERMDKKLSLAGFGAWLVKWFFYLGSFIAASDILGLDGVTDFLYQDVMSFAGKVILSMAVLLLGILAANFFSDLVSSAVKASGIHTGNMLGNITRWAIVIFTVFTVLSKLGVGDYLQDLYRAVILMLAVAGGLAFGLGGKEYAQKVVNEIQQNLKD